MFALGNGTFACGVRSARERSFTRLRRLAVRRKLEDAYWRRSHAHCRRGNAPSVRKPNPSDFRGRYFARNWTIPVAMLATVVATTATLSSNSRKSTIVFVYILLPFCGNSSPRTTFLREANSYKQALALRNLQMDSHKLTWTEAVKLAQNRPL